MKPVWGRSLRAVGRAIYLSIYGNGIFTRPLVDRADDEAVVAHLYQPDSGARIDDEEQWKRGNPGLLCGIKDIEHMRAMCRKAQADRSYRRTFLSEEMNLPVDPSVDPIVTVTEWDAIQGLEAEGRWSSLSRDRHRRLGFCLCRGTLLPADWPASGDRRNGQRNRTCIVAVLADGVGGRYEEMHRLGELVLVGDRWADAGAFIKHVMEWVGDADIREGPGGSVPTQGS